MRGGLARALWNRTVYEILVGCSAVDANALVPNVRASRARPLFTAARRDRALFWFRFCYKGVWGYVWIALLTFRVVTLFKKADR